MFGLGIVELVILAAVALAAAGGIAFVIYTSTER